MYVSVLSCLLHLVGSNTRGKGMVVVGGFSSVSRSVRMDRPHARVIECMCKSYASGRDEWMLHHPICHHVTAHQYNLTSHALVVLHMLCALVVYCYVRWWFYICYVRWWFTYVCIACS